MAAYGRIWPHMTFKAPARVGAAYGRIWPHMAAYGHLTACGLFRRTCYSEVPVCKWQKRFIVVGLRYDSAKAFLVGSAMALARNHASSRTTSEWVTWAIGEGMTDISEASPTGVTKPGLFFMQRE